MAARASTIPTKSSLSAGLRPEGARVSPPPSPLFWFSTRKTPKTPKKSTPPRSRLDRRFEECTTEYACPSPNLYRAVEASTARSREERRRNYMYLEIDRAYRGRGCANGRSKEKRSVSKTTDARRIPTPLDLSNLWIFIARELCRRFVEKRVRGVLDSAPLGADAPLLRTRFLLLYDGRRG